MICKKSSSPEPKAYDLILKLGMKHQGEEFYIVYINHNPGMIFTYFTAWSTQVAHALENGKLSKYHLYGKNLKEMD